MTLVAAGVRLVGQQAEAARDGGRTSARPGRRAPGGACWQRGRPTATGDDGPGRRAPGGACRQRGRRPANGAARQRSAHVGHHVRQRSLVTLALSLPDHSAQKVRTAGDIRPYSYSYSTGGSPTRGSPR